jgi:flagellar protein FlaG
MPTEITSLASGYTYKSKVAKADSMPAPTLVSENPASVQSQGVNHQAISKLESLPQLVERNLEFRVDGETGQQVIRVVDSESGELIRQIPPEQILRVISQAQETLDQMMTGVLLDDKV